MRSMEKVQVEGAEGVVDVEKRIGGLEGEHVVTGKVGLGDGVQRQRTGVQEGIGTGGMQEGIERDGWDESDALTYDQSGSDDCPVHTGTHTHGSDDGSEDFDDMASLRRSVAPILNYP